MSFNRIIVVGNLGKDPELRYTPQGTAVADFSLATNEKRRDKSGEMVDSTMWFKVTVWGKQAEAAAKYLVKGSSVYISGSLRMDEWQDREGNARVTLGVQATEMQFLGSRSDSAFGAAAGSESDHGRNVTEESFPATSGGDDDIPF